MTSLSRRPENLTSVNSTSSIFEILFKQNKQVDNPQDDACDFTKEQLSAVFKQPTLLADLHLLQQLTQQLQIATLSYASSNNDDDDNDEAAQSIPATAETENLAALYCRRAAALLAFVGHDATTTVPLDVLIPTSSSDASSDEANQPLPMLEAVQQALQDAQAAATLTLNSATIAEAHFLSAQCSRSLGELSHARAFTALAAAALPESTAITTLADQLDVEARVTDPAYFASHLRMTSSVLIAMIAASSAQIAQHLDDEDEDNNDQPDQRPSKYPGPIQSPSTSTVTPPAELDTFWRQLSTHFQALEEAAHSMWLEKLERLVHQNVHHCCALPMEVRQLDTTLQNALAMLTLLMQSSSACSVLSLDMTEDAFARTLEKLNHSSTSSPQTLAQNRTARRWIVHTWAPAVRLASNLATGSNVTDTLTRCSDERSVFVDLSRDLLLMLSRLLQASGSWRRCTAMAHSLAYAEMSHDLAKNLRSDDADPAAWSRLELQCAEARATALLQRITGHDEALKIFRESLQAAIHTEDHEYELRSRLHITKTLRLMEEPEVAHAELRQLLARSRALNDVYIEAMTQYELGEHFVQLEELETAQEHFQAAQTICTRTANCGSSWRSRSIQQAIAFYARLRPSTRRGAMRCSVSTLLRVVNDEEDDDSDESEEEMAGEDEDERPKERRQAFCLKNKSSPHRSLMSTIMGTTTNATSKKPRRTMDWRESVLTAMWPGQSTDSTMTLKE